jgi:hypothetical protein
MAMFDSIGRGCLYSVIGERWTTLFRSIQILFSTDRDEGTFWNEKRPHAFGFAFPVSSWSSCPMLRISAHHSSFTTFGKNHRLYRNS